MLRLLVPALGHRPRRNFRRFLVIVCATIIAGADGCASMEPVRVSPRTNPASDDPSLVNEVAFRTRFGLDARIEWIRLVRTDPSVVTRTFGVPLLPTEEAVLLARARGSEAVLAVAVAYASEHTDSSGGHYVDSATGTVVVLFTSDVAKHDASLRKLTHPSARLEIREVSHTVRELEQAQAASLSHAAWLRSLGYEIVAVDVDIPTNRVVLSLAGADPSKADEIARRIAGEGLVTVAISQDPVHALPRGSLRGRVLDGAGDPVAGIDIEAIGDIDNGEPDGSFGYASDVEGQFRIASLAEMWWTVTAIDLRPGGSGQIVGSARVRVTAGEEAYVEIVVNLDLTPSP